MHLYTPDQEAVDSQVYDLLLKCSSCCLLSWIHRNSNGKLTFSQDFFFFWWLCILWPPFCHVNTLSSTACAFWRFACCKTSCCLLRRSPASLPWAEPPRGLSTTWARSSLKRCARAREENLATRLVGTCSHCRAPWRHSLFSANRTRCKHRNRVCFRKGESSGDFHTSGRTYTHTHTHIQLVSESETHKQIPEMKQKPGNKVRVEPEHSAAVAKIPNNNNNYRSRQVNRGDCKLTLKVSDEQFVHHVWLWVVVERGGKARMWETEKGERNEGTKRGWKRVFTVACCRKTRWKS